MDWNRYLAPKKSLWTIRQGGFHEIVQCVDLQQETLPQATYALLGYASDEGVRRIPGRMGASEGPAAFRAALARLAHHENPPLLDVGDIICPDGDLEASQRALSDLVAKLHQDGLFPLVIGGSHDLAWGHYQGLADKDTVGLLNIDAHFDLRAGPASSGTSFAQIAQERQQKGLPFDYLVLGIQPNSNSQLLFERAQEFNVSWILADEMARAPEALEAFLQRNQKVYATVCLDVFAAAFAPGVSAPQSLGLLPAQVLPLLDQVAKSGQAVGFSLAELAPPLDRDQLTAHLAANLAARWMRINPI